jgi:hypothetical protein
MLIREKPENVNLIQNYNTTSIPYGKCLKLCSKSQTMDVDSCEADLSGGILRSKPQNWEKET